MEYWENQVPCKEVAVIIEKMMEITLFLPI